MNEWHAIRLIKGILFYQKHTMPFHTRFLYDVWSYHDIKTLSQSAIGAIIYIKLFIFWIFKWWWWRWWYNITMYYDIILWYLLQNGKLIATSCFPFIMQVTLAPKVESKLLWSAPLDLDTFSFFKSMLLHQTHHKIIILTLINCIFTIWTTSLPTYILMAHWQ